jgi:hypothetical protein
MNTQQRMNAIESEVATVKADLSDIKSMLAALIEANAPAKTAPVTPAPEAPKPQVSEGDAPTKPLSRSAWQTLRRTKGGQVRAAFKGLTREAAFEAGLCPGFHLPTNERRDAIRAYNAAKVA